MTWVLSAEDIKYITIPALTEGLDPFGKTDKLKIKVTIYYKISDVIKVSTKQCGNIQEETL